MSSLQVEIFKPATSKANNSETYIVGLGFQGISEPLLEALLGHVGASTFDNMAMLPREALPSSFVSSVIAAGRFFAMRTRDSLEDAYVKRIAPQLELQVCPCFRRAHCRARSLRRVVSALVEQSLLGLAWLRRKPCKSALRWSALALVHAADCLNRPRAVMQRQVGAKLSGLVFYKLHGQHTGCMDAH